MSNLKGYIEDWVMGCIVVGAIFLLLVVIPIAIAGIHYDSERGGTQTGYISAVDNDGIIWANYQIYFKTGNESALEETYCVHRDNQELVKQLQSAQLSQEKVAINYEGVRAVGFGLCDGEQINSVSVLAQ